MRKGVLRFLLVLLVTLAAAGAAAGGRGHARDTADASPVVLTLQPGQSAAVSADVAIALPPALDVALVVDASGSTLGELNDLRAQFASTTGPAIVALAPDAQFAVVTFQDFPYATGSVDYGDATQGDLPFVLGQAMTGNLPAIQLALNGAQVRSGADAPDAQLAALYKTLTASELSWPASNYPAGTIAATTPPAGTFGAVDFRTAGQPVVVLISHWPFHNAERVGDTAVEYPYEFSTKTSSDVTAQLDAVGARFVGVALPPTTSTMPADPASAGFDLFAASGRGVVETLPTNTGTGVSDAVETGLLALDWSISPALDGCGPLTLAATPASATGVTGAQEHFDETIGAPADAAPQTIACSIDFREAGQTVATQSLHVTVESPSSPPTTTSTTTTSTTTPTTSTTTSSTPPPPVRCVVPKLVGLTLAKARRRLARAHCATGKVGRRFSTTRQRGRVIAQRPKASPRRLPKGTRVAVTIGKGPRH